MESFKHKLKPNPFEKANFVSKLCFIWIIPLYKKGYKKTLNAGDLFKSLRIDRSELIGNRFEA